MTNEQLIKKMKEDMKMRGFSHWTETSYIGKTKEMMKYLLILTLKYTKTAQNYQDKKTNNIKIVILK